MNAGVVAVITIISFTIFSGIILALRCISRLVITRNLGADDVCAVVAYLASVAFTILFHIEYQYGMGQEYDRISPENWREMTKYGWASIICYGLGVTFFKLSALLQYLRFLFGMAYRTTCYILIAICCITGTVAIFLGIFRCSPISFAWDDRSRHGRCIDFSAWSFFAASLVVITNVILIALPLSAFRKLNLPRAQKRALIAVFALGGCDFIISTIRLYSVYLTTTPSSDLSRDDAITSLWSSLEVNVGIICISLPPLKALFVAVLPKLALGTEHKQSNEISSRGSGILQLQPTGSVRTNSDTPRYAPDPWAIP